MKTIVIPVFDGTITKNILRTNVFRHLQEAPDLRIVIIPPRGKDDAYTKEFVGERVVVASSSLWEEGVWGSFFAGLFLHSIPTTFMKIRQIDWYWNTGKYVHYVGVTVLRYLGHMKLWRTFLMFLGNLEPINTKVRTFYEGYRPDAIFAPTMIPSLEVSLMRLARHDKKKIIGMAKSWDNLTSKAFLRVFPDRLIVPNVIGVEEATRIYGFPKERVVATGIPQYDAYIHSDFLEPKEEFFSSLGLNPKKKTILYAPAGDWMSPSDKDILGDILAAIRDGQIPDTQVLLRLHPAYESKTEELAGDPNLVVERPGQHLGGLKGYEFFDRDVRHLASSIAYTDLTINTASTMSIEAAIYDKPIIIIGFDSDPNVGYRDSVRRYYDREHYVPIVQSGGAWLVKSKAEMLQAIVEYLANPEVHQEGRKRIVEQECFRMDGKASDRIAQAILGVLSMDA